MPNDSEEVTNTAAGWVARDANVVWHGFTQMQTYESNSPIIVERAEGRELIDVDGRRYLDAISSLWVTTLGHRVAELDDALRDQIDLVAHSTLLGNGNRTTIEFAEALAQVVPVDQPHFLFASDGSAAVEQALKIAFQYWTNQGVAGRDTYLAFGGAYHGDTLGSLSVGAGGFGTEIFDPLRFGVLRAPGYEDPQCIEIACSLIAEHASELAAVILEPLVQGAAGMQMRAAGEFAALSQACKKHEVLLICDEVATGFGRTGTMFASEQCHLRPDIMAIGKGITAGYLPLAATVANERVYSAFLGEDLGERTLYHGHSYSGNALASAVGLAHLRLFDTLKVLRNVNDRAMQLEQLLELHIAPLSAVGSIRQQGLMVGVELAPPPGAVRWGRKVSAESVERGVLIRPLGDVVVLMPILTSTAEEITRIVLTLAESITAVSQKDDPP
ncbi:MAG: adenosylmethionine--8-amino-7-oxononanoate transaminase [Microthrixaceae bacterium]